MSKIGLRKPDLLAHKPGVAWIIDVGVATVNGDLDVAASEKARKYGNIPEIIECVEAEVGVAPLFAGFILSWRGDLAPASLSAAREWGITDSELEFLAAICVEHGAMLHRLHQRSTLRASRRQGSR